MIRKCNCLFLLRITRSSDKKNSRFKKFYKLKQSSKNKHRNDTKIHTLLYNKMERRFIRRLTISNSYLSYFDK